MIDSEQQAHPERRPPPAVAGGEEPTPARPLARRRLEAWLWAIALGLGFAQAWTGRHDIGADGVSYLDLADAFQRGDWAGAINAYWSPLYPALIAVAETVLPGAARMDFALLQALHAVIFVAALAAFAFFLRQVIDHRRTRLTRSTGASIGLPEPLLIIAAYSLAIHALVSLVTVSVATPDLLSQTFLLCAAGLLLRMRARRTGWTVAVLLGVVLGLGYLAKAAIFPVALLTLSVAMAWSVDRRRGLRNGLIAGAAFLAVSAPLVLMLSRAQGHLTFGESGRLNYAWYVLGNGFQRNWQGGSEELGFAAHPTRQLLASPPVYEFDGPVGGTYPVWLDPVYWHEGARTTFSPGRQLAVVAKHLGEFGLLFTGLSGLLVALLVAGFAGGRLSGYAREVGQYGGILVPALGALAMYTLVHVEPRFLGAYVIIIGVAMLASLRLPNQPWSGRLFEGVTVAFVLVCLIPATWFVTRAVARDFLRADDVRQEVYLAEALSGLGLSPGEPIATVGFGAEGWARLARVRVIAEVPWGAGYLYWTADPQVAEDVLTLFRSAGARLALASDVPAHRSDGWIHIERTNFFYRFLR